MAAIIRSNKETNLQVKWRVVLISCQFLSSGDWEWSEIGHERSFSSPMLLRIPAIGDKSDRNKSVAGHRASVAVLACLQLMKTNSTGMIRLRPPFSPSFFDFEMMELIEMNAIRRRIQTMVIQSPQLADVATVGQKCNWENNDYFWEYFPVS